jgi:hypothetical protein
MEGIFMMQKPASFSAAFTAFSIPVAAHSGHLSHSTGSETIPLIGVAVGIAVASAGLFLSFKKYARLSEKDDSS